MVKKIVLTLEGKLKKKYGANITQVKTIFDSLVTADAAKGLSTLILYVDDVTTAGKYGYPIPATFDEAACKNIVDQIYWKESPEYLAIFGAQDIFPFQQLVNQLHQPGVAGSDPDALIPSDLPYACDSPYSTDCNAFTSPTRVVGRIPDMPLNDQEEGIGDIEYVKTVIESINTSVSADPDIFKNYFAISADVWTGSTQISLRNTFSNAFQMKISPPDLAGSYSASEIGALPHFFNLHGALSRPSFYGQKGGSYPEALRPADLSGKVNPGTFVSAECCYGAQLLPLWRGMSMASTYLLNKAAVFMGSSTVAYGPASGQGLADLMCQYFSINVLNGASSGSALLSARQKFLSVSGPTLDFHELKTLAQFHILGDPSIHPVQSPEPKQMNTIEDRRMTLQAKGINLGLTIPNTEKISDSRSQNPLLEFPSLQNLVQFGVADLKTVFEVDEVFTNDFAIAAHTFNIPNMAGKQKVRYHVFQKGSIFDNGICDLKVLVVKERGNQFMGYREYLSR
jgi:hypothetical protein